MKNMYVYTYIAITKNRRMSFKYSSEYIETARCNGLNIFSSNIDLILV